MSREKNKSKYHIVRQSDLEAGTAPQAILDDIRSVAEYEEKIRQSPETTIHPTNPSFQFLSAALRTAYMVRDIIQQKGRLIFWENPDTNGRRYRDTKVEKNENTGGEPPLWPTKFFGEPLLGKRYKATHAAAHNWPLAKREDGVLVELPFSSFLCMAVTQDIVRLFCPSDRKVYTFKRDWSA